MARTETNREKKSNDYRDVNEMLKIMKISYCLNLGVIGAESDITVILNFVALIHYLKHACIRRKLFP